MPQCVCKILLGSVLNSLIQNVVSILKILNGFRTSISVATKGTIEVKVT